MRRAKGVRERLERAVAEQLMADVPVACFLSGGVDSSIVARDAEVAASGGKGFIRCRWGLRKQGYDETGFAERVARHIGSKHTRLEVDVHQDVMGTLAGLVRGAVGAAVWGFFHFSDTSFEPGSAGYCAGGAGGGWGGRTFWRV